MTAKESVWDYPRPPIIDRDPRRVTVTLDGVTIADTLRSLRVLETSHPPVYYLPGADVAMEHLFPTDRSTWCEYKGRAAYWTVAVGEREAVDAAWSYPHPTSGYEALAGHFAFYPSKMTACTVGEHEVIAQAGDFYGGWITPDITGPFKGGPGTLGW